ncbi:MAG: enoyl-CoA hydratase/isomerase family protein [Myxococcales bacterium]
MGSGFRTEQHEGIATWTFDRPEARNAIDEGVVDALSAALDAAEHDRGLRAVVLTGAGDSVFVSGADLKFLRSATPERRELNDTRMLGLMDRLEALPVPVIAALNGAVIGGGTEIAMACDLRIAEPHTSLMMKHAAMGISPGWGGLARMAGLVGRSTSAKLLFTALPVGAEEALRVGLVDELAATGGSRERALELARAVAQNSPTTVAEVKRLLWFTYRAGPQAGSPEERALFLVRQASPDHREALTAFFDKRGPNFKPRGEG